MTKGQETRASERSIWERKNWIYADPSFSIPTVNFSPKQAIYIKIETISDGDKERSLKLLNSQKEVLQTLTLKNETENTFTQTLNAPNNEGTYYLNVRIIDNGGSNYNAESNINVGQGSGEVKSVAVAQTNVNINNEEPQSTPTVGPSPKLTGEKVELTVTPKLSTSAGTTMTPMPMPTIDQEKDIVSETTNVLVKIVQNFLNFFKNLFRNQ